MGKNQSKLFLLTPDDLKQIKRLVQHLERALTELAELRRITTFDDRRRHYGAAESDLIEEADFIKRQLEFHFQNNPEF